MTRQEFGAILFVGFSLLAGAVIILIRQVNTGFLPDLARFESPDSSAIYSIQETEASHDSPPGLTSSAGISDDPVKRVKSISSLSINTSSLKDLQDLPGIGPELARRIVSYRQQIGTFKSIEQLLDIKGIGPVKLARLKPYISFH